MRYEANNEERNMPPEDMPILELDLSNTKHSDAAAFSKAPRPSGLFWQIQRRLMTLKP